MTVGYVRDSMPSAVGIGGSLSLAMAHSSDVVIRASDRKVRLRGVLRNAMQNQKILDSRLDEEARYGTRTEQ